MSRFTVDITERDYYSNYEIIHGRNYKTTDENSLEDVIDELGKLEDLFDSYGIETLEDLNVILAEYFCEIKDHTFKTKG